MTAEFPDIATKEQIPSHDLFPLLSSKTILSALPVAEQLSLRAAPDHAAVTELVNNASSDIQALGLPVTAQDVASAVEKTEEQFRSSSEQKKEEPVIVDRKRRHREVGTEVNLDEYKGVIDGLVQNYGLNKKAWERVSGLLSASVLTSHGVSAAYRIGIESARGWKNFDTKMKHARLEVLKLDKQTPQELIDSVKKTAGEALKHRKLSAETKKTIKDVLGDVWAGAWPVIISPVSMIVDAVGRREAGKLFMQERGRLQEQINNRIADSLFMRNFEFLHDQSSGEMLQIINNGKDATVDLVSVIYEELLPLKASLVGDVLSQGAVSVAELVDAKGNNPLFHLADFAMATAKALILEGRIKPNATVIQKQRAEELKQWDKVNTKILSTLQGLETVRTSGNAEAGSDVLYGALADRDFVEQGGLRERRMQDLQLNQIFSLLDIAVPVGTTYGILSSLTKPGAMVQNEKGEFVRATADDLMTQGISSLFRIGGSVAAQQSIRQSYLALTHLFTERIIPDIQDIRRMDELLGSYQKLDHPSGIQEQRRKPVTDIKRFDISIRNLSFKDILHDVSLDIPQGAFVTIKGRSGIGKSTVFRHLVGLYESPAGTISYGGVDVDAIKKYGESSLISKIGYANQNPQFFEDMTLRENLLLWTRSSVTNDRVVGVLKDLHLEHIIDRLDSKVKHFSGGEMRRIGIARALLKDPKVLLLDEPTANLDAASTQQVLSIISELRRKRPDMTVIAITHDPVFEKISEKIVDFETLNRKPDLGDHQVLEAVARAGQKNRSV